MGSILCDKCEPLDFAMKRFSIPMPPCKLLINKEIEGQFERKDRIALTSDFSILPAFEESYGFCGLVQGVLKPIDYTTGICKGLYSNLVYYDNVRYIKTVGDQYVFALENKGYSHKNFKGTSGAPIIDSQGNLVSLVTSGEISQSNPDEWLIYGVNLSYLSTVIDINCGLI
jgi:hypothetical protein